MSDFYEQQTAWLKSWQENQERLMKQYVGWGEQLMSGMAGNVKKESDPYQGWFQSQGDMEGQFKEFYRRLSEMINSAWAGKLSAEMLRFLNVSSLNEFYKNWLATMQLPEGGWREGAEFFRSFMEKNEAYLSLFGGNHLVDQLNWVFGMLQGTLGQEESYFSDIVKGYQDIFSKMFETTTAQGLEKFTEVFDGWAKELEKNLSAPKLGIHRDLAHDLSQLLVLSQNYIQSYQKYARLVEATARKAGANFQAKLSEATLRNEPVHRFVDLCALWSVENERVFTDVMGSEEFARLQGEFVNAGHRLKIHLNKLGERALEQTPLALKRDLDLAIAEITELKRDVRALRRELRERERTEPSRKGASAPPQEKNGRGRAATVAAPEGKGRRKGAVASAATGRAKGAGAVPEEPAQGARAGRKKAKEGTGRAAKTRTKNA